MLVSKIVYIDILTSLNVSKETEEKKLNKVISEMKEFGFKYDGWRKVQITRDGMTAAFIRASFLTPTEESIVIPDSYVTELVNITALVRLPIDDDGQAPSPFQEIYLTAREYLHVDPLLDDRHGE
jgi:hypothetical protein